MKKFRSKKIYPNFLFLNKILSSREREYNLSPCIKVCKKKNDGFTLIELLVVISIISLLASILLSNVQQGRLRARDAKRLEDVQQLLKAAALYQSENVSGGVLPDPSIYGEGGESGGWDNSEYDTDGDGLPFMSFLVTNKIMSATPHDPSGTNSTTSKYAYRYYRYPAGYCPDGCGGGAFYVIGINRYESVPNYPNPNFSCHVPGYAGGPPEDPTLRDWSKNSGFVYLQAVCENTN